MELSGQHILNATTGTLWTMLMDTDTLTRIIPGISRLEQTGDNTFKSIIEIKLGPVNASFAGDLQLENVSEPKGFTLKVQQSSSVGKANAAIIIEMIPLNENQTEISFNGHVKLTGLLAGMGQRLLTGVANMLTKQFFKNLEKELEKQFVK